MIKLTRTLSSTASRLTQPTRVIVGVLTLQPTWSRWVSVGLIASMVLGVGLLDYITTAFISFRPFYYVPIALAVSWLGWEAGSLTSIGSTAIWVLGDYHAASPWIRGP